MALLAHKFIKATPSASHHPTPHPHLTRVCPGMVEKIRKRSTDSNHLTRTTIAEDLFLDDITAMIYTHTTNESYGTFVID
jgi:hypothetical protein